MRRPSSLHLLWNSSSKVRTSDRPIGYGEASADMAPKVRAAAIKRMSRSIGVNPIKTELTYNALYRCFFFSWLLEGFMIRIGVIDEALPGIKEVTTNTSIYNPLGNFRNKIQVILPHPDI